MPNAVSPAKLKALLDAMARYGIREDDLDEQFIRAGGPGGQKVNKTSSAVVLKHRLSGHEVRSSQSRSQAMNRFLARRLLVDLIEAEHLGEASAKEQAIEKIRRSKRKRSKRAKDKMLADKHHQAEKKRLRKEIGD